MCAIKVKVACLAPPVGPRHTRRLNHRSEVRVTDGAPNPLEMGGFVYSLTSSSRSSVFHAPVCCFPRGLWMTPKRVPQTDPWQSCVLIGVATGRRVWPELGTWTGMQEGVRFGRECAAPRAPACPPAHPRQHRNTLDLLLYNGAMVSLAETTPGTRIQMRWCVGSSPLIHSSFLWISRERILHTVYTHRITSDKWQPL